MTDALLPPDPNAPKPTPRPPLRLADLPAQCTEVLQAAMRRLRFARCLAWRLLAGRASAPTGRGWSSTRR